MFFFSSRRRHTRFDCDWSSDVCSSDLRCRSRNGSGRGIIFLWKIFADESERSEEHTSELQSQSNLVCRLLLEKKKKMVSSISLYTRYIDDDSRRPEARIVRTRDVRS